MCKNCGTIVAGLLFVVAVLFLLRDLNVWNFWNISGWTVLFFLVSLKVAHHSCGCMEKKK